MVKGSSFLGASFGGSAATSAEATKRSPRPSSPRRSRTVMVVLLKWSGDRFKQRSYCTEPKGQGCNGTVTPPPSLSHREMLMSALRPAPEDAGGLRKATRKGPEKRPARHSPGRKLPPPGRPISAVLISYSPPFHQP